MLVTFDTQEVVKELRTHGFTEDQAEVLTNIQKRVINESMDTSLATKDDIKLLDKDIQLLDKKIDSIETRLTIVEKMLWIVVAGVITLVIKSFI